ncbi:MAG: PEP-CTERM sorting domain-containing protein, partial [Phycisphaerales bacterium]|nr:PEP-CTERM sorting domain-containing protein [Phycisphaerales bacterium]
LATFVDAPTPGYHPYAVTPPSDGPLSLTTPWIYPAGFDAQRSDDLLMLFAQHEVAALSDDDVAIAFQLAIYEILTEPGTDYDLLSGGFLVIGSDAHVLAANAMLDGLAPTPGSNLFFLRNINEKDIIISDRVPAVPEPITMASLGLCLLGAGSYFRRRTKV